MGEDGRQNPPGWQEVPRLAGRSHQDWTDQQQLQTGSKHQIEDRTCPDRLRSNTSWAEILLPDPEAIPRCIFSHYLFLRSPIRRNPVKQGSGCIHTKLKKMSAEVGNESRIISLSPASISITKAHLEVLARPVITAHLQHRWQGARSNIF